MHPSLAAAFFIMVLLCTSHASAEELPSLSFTTRTYDSAMLPDTMKSCGAGKLSSNSPLFGGLSGITVTADSTHYVMISDNGYYASGSLFLDTTHHLTSMTLEHFGALVSTEQRAATRKNMVDAESIRLMADGHAWVSYERVHRVWEYTVQPDYRLQYHKPADIPAYPKINIRQGNSGFEAFSTLHDGRVLLLAEKIPPNKGERGFTQMLISEHNGWRMMRYPIKGTYYPTDMAMLPDGDLLILERSYTTFSGFHARLMRLPQTQLKEETVTPLLVADVTAATFNDNAEGLEIIPINDDEVLVILVTDDNYRLWQGSFVSALCYQYRAFSAPIVAKSKAG